MSEIPILYTYFRSTCSARVRIALNWKQIEYTPFFINLLKNEQNDKEYLEKNPGHSIPMLSIDNIDIAESTAIIEYLEETRPQNPLLPKLPADRANVRRIMNMIACGIQPLQNPPQLALFPLEKRAERARTVISNGFDSLEKVVAKTAGKYSVGDSVTAADLYLYPMYHAAQRYDVETKNYPTINRVFGELNKLEPFTKAAWYNQPDCPEKLKTKNQL
ncbi:hypothetical protein BB558_006054 [Smittium angustum]|uniref:Maleylacetoacetate isomerase n=1 Tax=Smittium angustum TaxID=133377 RepID=A0A2U1IYU2_SMIAN|nr:hypothetical protein BB558_006054 [Smittium angustum]